MHVGDCFQLRTADLVYHKIPSPTHAHANVLTRLLTQVCSEQILSSDDLQHRDDITEKVRTLLATLAPGKGWVFCLPNLS